MSNVLRALLTCAACGISGAATWNSANNSAELVKVSGGFIHVGRGRGGEEYFICKNCRGAVGNRLLDLRAAH